jgi:hypothetical protein
MQSLPEKGNVYDGTLEGGALKRQKPSRSCKDQKPKEAAPRPKAAVPKWLIYDDQQIRCFGSPQGHENDYSYLYSRLHYANEWVASFIGNISSLYTDAYVADDIYLVLDLDWISEQRTFTLTVSNLIFDHYVVLHRIHELVFWTLIWECSCRNIEVLVISNPLPLVRQAFLKLTHTHCFYFLTNPGGDLILDISIIRLITSRIPDEVKATGCMRLEKTPPKINTQLKILPIASDIPDSFISQNYLDNFEYFLSRILVARKGEGGRHFNCEVARVYIDFKTCGNMVSLDIFEVRPCAQGLKLGRVIMYILVVYCVQNDVDTLYLRHAFSPTQSLCLSMGFKPVRDLKSDFCMLLKDMKARALPEQYGLPAGLLRRDKIYSHLFRLDRSRFPTADQLNDQEFVDARRV